MLQAAPSFKLFRLKKWAHVGSSWVDLTFDFFESGRISFFCIFIKHVIIWMGTRQALAVCMCVCLSECYSLVTADTEVILIYLKRPFLFTVAGANTILASWCLYLYSAQSGYIRSYVSCWFGCSVKCLNAPGIRITMSCVHFYLAVWSFHFFLILYYWNKCYAFWNPCVIPLRLL